MDKVTSQDPATRGSPKAEEQPPPRSARPSTPDEEEDASKQPQAAESEFVPITTSIPEDSLWEDFNNLSFSKRGSLMFGGKSDPFTLLSMAKPGNASTTTSADGAPDAVALPQAESVTDIAPKPDGEKALAPAVEDSPSAPNIRVVSMDVERESQKVRSLYESGEGLDWQDGGRDSYCERLAPTEEVPSDEEENVVYGFPLTAPSFFAPDSILTWQLFQRLSPSSRTSARYSFNRRSNYHALAISHVYSSAGQFILAATR